MCYFLLLALTFSAYAVFSTCLDFLELGISRNCRPFHTILPQTGRLCFPNLLFLGTIQCDKIHASAVQIHSKWSAESKNSNGTVPQFYNNSAQFYFLRLTYRYEFHCLQQNEHLGQLLHWLYSRRQELPHTYYRNYVTVKKDMVTMCSNMGFYIEICTQLLNRPVVFLTRDLTLISVNWTVLCYSDRVPAPSGRSVLLDLLNKVEWGCAHCCWATQFSALAVVL